MAAKVTIGIPTLNRAAYLRVALQSALAQTYSNLEVLVSNNACTDETATLLSSISDPRLRVITQPSTIAMMENFNACVNAATGKYFLLLSDDDILEPTAIEEMVGAYDDSERRGEKIGFVYCNGTVIDAAGNPTGAGKPGPPIESAREMICQLFAGKRTPWPCAILFRRADVLPGYDVRFSLMADTALWVRVAAARGSARYLSRKLVRYRLHQNASVTSRVGQWHKANIDTGEFAIEQLRAQGEGEDVAKAIRRSVRRVNTGITPYYINLALRHNKRRALSEYWAYRGMFKGMNGITALTSGLALLLLPDSVRAWLRRCLTSLGLLSSP